MNSRFPTPTRKTAQPKYINTHTQAISKQIKFYMGRRRQRMAAYDEPPWKRRLVRKRVEIEKESRSMDEFEILNKIGEGTYGVVYRGKDKKTGEIVAVKEQPRCDALPEVEILASLHHPSIVGFKSMAVGTGSDADDDTVSMVMECVENNLQFLLENMRRPFTQSEVKCLMLQLLQGVHYLHANRVLHRDLKTSNLLLSNKGELKICDFGLACSLNNSRQSIRNTGTVVTLFYRAPELLLEAKSYSKPIDMWSVGCIMAELFSRELLFHGYEEIDQIGEIFKILGSPDEAIWPGFSKLPGVKGVDKVAKLVRNNRSRLRHRFRAMSCTGYAVFSEAGFDLLRKLLMYNPKNRITAKQALDHPWFRQHPLPKSKHLMPTFLPSYAWQPNKEFE